MRVLATFLFILGLAACGVKGNPQPPLSAPTLSRGEPNFSKATENVKVKKLKNKINVNSNDPDWDDAQDFPATNEEK